MKLPAEFYKEPYGNVDEEKVAAEIQRLRALLREIADYSGDSGVVDRVREALGE